MTDWRLEAFRVWKEMTEPEWANVNYKNQIFKVFLIILHQIANLNKSLDDVDPELISHFAKN